MNIDEKLEESIENKYMQDDKGKNKMELTIEESVYILKRKDFNTYVENKAIETLLTAYEEKKEANKKLDKEAQGYLEELAGDGSMNIRKIQELESELEKEKEKNKELEKKLEEINDINFPIIT